MDELMKEPTSLDDMRGVFVESLVRTNKKIKQDRAIAIAETAEMKYKRAVEDILVKLRQARRDRENMLDMSPENTLSLIVASDFDADTFVQKDIQMGISIRNLEIELEIADKQYKRLFVGEGVK